MNVSINNIAYDVIELYRANYKDTDSLDIRQVYHWVNTGRAMLIKQRLDKNVFDIYEEEIQKINLINLIQVSDSTTIVKSVSNIPSTISRKGYPGTLTRVWYPVASITIPDFSTYPIQIVSPKRFERVGNRKFNSSLHYATVRPNQKLYLKNYTAGGIANTAAEGVFQNPLEVMTLNNTSDIYNADYPINSNLVRDLISMIVSDKFQLILKQQEDKQTSDGIDSTTQ